MIGKRQSYLIFLLGLLVGAALIVVLYETGGRFAAWQRYNQWRTERDYQALLERPVTVDSVELDREQIIVIPASTAGFAHDQALFEQFDAQALTEQRNAELPNYWQLDGDLQQAVAPNRARLRDYLGPLPDGPVQIVSRETIDLPETHCPGGPTSAEKLTIQGRWPDLTFGAYLLAPAGGRDNGRAVVALHGHSSSPERLLGLEPEDYTRHMALRLACAGYAVIAPAVTSNRGANSAISARVALHGATLYGLMVSLGQSSIDVLADEYPERPVGLYGISNGGLIALFTNALDARPIFVVAESILTPYWETTITPNIRRSGRNDYFFYFNGPLWLEFDLAQLSFLSLPDVLIFTVGELDPERSGWEEQWALVEAHYRAAGLAERAELIRFHGHHELAEDLAINRLAELLP